MFLADQMVMIVGLLKETCWALAKGQFCVVTTDKAE